MGKIYEKLKIINELYSNTQNSINTKQYSKHYLKLNSYLDEFGLIKRTNPKRAIKFLKDLEVELPMLNKVALNNVYTKFNDTIWKLQTGDIIPLTEIIYINDISFSVHIIEVIHNYKILAESKKKNSASKSKKKNSASKSKKKNSTSNSNSN